MFASHVQDVRSSDITGALSPVCRRLLPPCHGMCEVNKLKDWYDTNLIELQSVKLQVITNALYQRIIDVEYLTELLETSLNE